MKFNIQNYAEIMMTILASGYKLTMFNHSNFSDAQIILRHDIDIDLNAALVIARLEKELTLTSTYFISMRSPFYNPFSENNCRIINEIHSLGHEVATHVNYELETGYPFDDIKMMCQYFPFMNQNIATVHHPGSMSNIQEMLNIPVINATYAPIFSGAMKYISDSTGRWRYGHPLESEAFKSKHSLILLTHPIWWVEPGETPLDKLKNFFDTKKYRKDDLSTYLPSFYKSNFL